MVARVPPKDEAAGSSPVMGGLFLLTVTANNGYYFYFKLHVIFCHDVLCCGWVWQCVHTPATEATLQ